ncbi:MAG TPA: lysylphosphatidylglycerol synthase domain-containing protein, partial [Gemmatimonadales bacterium]|nr:lysylphosphatidylglycerol synthase domain-containing protein [Gemmatimonadales bacterium]
MIRKWHAGLFVLGAAVFAYLVARIGLGQLASDAGRTGLMFVPIVLLYALVYACSALAWQLTMATDRSRPSFWRTYAVTIAAGAINFLTPVINAGGEPYRVAAMAPILGRQRAAGSVILHKMLHSFAYVLVWLTAIVLAFA